MRAIINGKKYDTSTAEYIASASYSGSRSDFQWWEEDLYRKRTGEFFVSGEGGPMTRYARAIGPHRRTGGAQRADDAIRAGNRPKQLDGKQPGHPLDRTGSARVG